MVRKTIDSKLAFRRICLILCDIAVIIAASALGLLLRFDLNPTKVDMRFVESLWRYLPVNIICTLIIFYILKLYHSIWRFAGIVEMQNVTAACIMSTIIQYAGLSIMDYPVPRSYHFLYGGMLFFLTLGNRFAYRFVRYVKRLFSNNSEIKKIMIIGGGNAANVIIKEIRTSEHINNTTVKCIIDDDPSKQGTYIQGVKVVGTRGDIIETVNLFHINEIIIAMPSVSKKTIREIVEICNETSCNLKILPGVYQLMTGEVSVSQLRDIEVEDLWEEIV